MNLFSKKDKDDGKEKCFVKRISTKRQQALASRELELLSIAEKLVEKEGFADFTMDKLTKNCSYSKGTVYNHFNSKEDLICALCIKSLQKETALFKHALTFEGNSRERCLAVLYAYQLHAYQDPTLFMCVLTAKTPAVMEKASSERISKQDILSKELTRLCDGLFEAGLEDGSLNLKPNAELHSLTFAVWAMAFGTNALLLSAGELDSISRLDNNLAPLNNANLLFDGIGWQPLSTDWDFANTWRRIANELFKDCPATHTE